MTGMTGEAVMRAAVELADELDAAALIVPSSTGGAARACAKYRRRRPIIALAHQPGVAEQLTLEWGVYPDEHGDRRHRRRDDRPRAGYRRATSRGSSRARAWC